MDEPDGLLSPRGSLWRSDVFALLHADEASTDVRLGPQYQIEELPGPGAPDGPIPPSFWAEALATSDWHPLPTFSAADVAAFNLAMKLFDRDFRAVSKLVQRSVRAWRTCSRGRCASHDTPSPGGVPRIA